MSDEPPVLDGSADGLDREGLKYFGLSGQFSGECSSLKQNLHLAIALALPGKVSL